MFIFKNPDGKNIPKELYATLDLSICYDVESYTLARLRFLKGNFMCGKFWLSFEEEPCANLPHFKKNLTKYFEEAGVPNFGEYLPQFITNSNLSPEQKNSVRELIL